MLRPATITKDMDACIASCQDCHRVCLETVEHCLAQGGASAGRHHLRLLMVSAEICATSADFLTVGSRLHVRTCADAAEACERSAEACERFGGDAELLNCAEVCRRCAESCRDLASCALRG